MATAHVRLRLEQPVPVALPAPDVHQRIVIGVAGDPEGGPNLIVRGAPGSGRTTTALHVLGRAVEGGMAATLWTPDRRRADAIQTVAQDLAPEAVRPVRTPAAFAYQVINTWRVERTEPLGPLELLTGARQDQILSDLLEQDDRAGGEWPSSFPDEMRAMPAFRMELRNFLATAGELDVDAERLAGWGRTLGRPEWIATARILDAYESGADFEVEAADHMWVDSARIQRLAAQVLRRWQEDRGRAGVTADAPVPELVIVDDLQDCTASTVELLDAMSGLGARVIAFADPDVATATYRGGEPLLDERAERALGANALELGAVHRGSAVLRRLSASLSTRLPTPRAPERRQVGVATGSLEGVADDVRIVTSPSEAQLGALVARRIRERHLHDGIPWDEQVVVVRAAADAEQVRRLLRRGGLQVSAARRALTYSTTPVTRALLDLVLLDAAERAVAAGGDAPSSEELRAAAERLVISPFIRADLLDVNRALRDLNVVVGAADAASADGDEGGAVVSAAVDLVSVLDDPTALDRVPGREGWQAGRFGALRSALRRAHAMWAARAGISRKAPRAALWELWQAAGVTDEWREFALRAGHVDDDMDSEWYDDQLDAVISLFRTADVWEQRTVDGTARDFASELVTEAVPTDTIARIGQRPAGVEVLTAAQVPGREWSDVYVVSLQDGHWPNTRLRDRILRADLLKDAARGAFADTEGDPDVGSDPAQARRAVLSDELRLLLVAATRARSRLTMGAVVAEDVAPSQFLDYAAPLMTVDRTEDGIYMPEAPAPSLSLRGMVGMLRASAARADDGAERRAATDILAVLAREGVRAADPDEWTGVGGLSSTDPLASGAPVRLSPSKVEIALKCPLRWFLSTSNGEGQQSFAQSAGTLVHAIAEACPDGGLDAMMAELDRLWAELDIDESTWAGQAERERVEGMVALLAEYLESGSKAVGREVVVRAEFAGAVISGRIDRLERADDGGSYIVDFKTGKGVPTVKSMSDNTQLAMYQIAAAESGMEVAGAKLVFVSRGKVESRIQQALDDEQLESWRDVVSGLVRDLGGETLEARPEENLCRTCPFQRACPARDAGRRNLA